MTQISKVMQKAGKKNEDVFFLNKYERVNMECVCVFITLLTMVFKLISAKTDFLKV